MRVLAIGAHPDDIEFGVGGTVAKHVKNGDKVYFLVMSDGEKGGAYKSVRRGEVRKSAKVLGIKNIKFLGLPDTNIAYNHKTIDKIEKHIKRIKPDMIYTHCLKDTHQDHYNTALATITAARNSAVILSYEVQSTFPNFNPQMYIDISKTLKLKIDALKCFTSQNHKRFMATEAIIGLVRFRGFQARTNFAEAFEVIRQVIK